MWADYRDCGEYFIRHECTSGNINACKRWALKQQHDKCQGTSSQTEIRYTASKIPPN